MSDVLQHVVHPITSLVTPYCRDPYIEEHLAPRRMTIDVKVSSRRSTLTGKSEEIPMSTPMMKSPRMTDGMTDRNHHSNATLRRSISDILKTREIEPQPPVIRPSREVKVGAVMDVIDAVTVNWGKEKNMLADELSLWRLTAPYPPARYAEPVYQQTQAQCSLGRRNRMLGRARTSNQRCLTADSPAGLRTMATPIDWRSIIVPTLPRPSCVRKRFGNHSYVRNCRSACSRDRLTSAATSSSTRHTEDQSAQARSATEPETESERLDVHKPTVSPDSAGHDNEISQPVLYPLASVDNDQNENVGMEGLLNISYLGGSSGSPDDDLLWEQELKAYLKTLRASRPAPTDESIKEYVPIITPQSVLYHRIRPQTYSQLSSHSTPNTHSNTDLYQQHSAENVAPGDIPSIEGTIRLGRLSLLSIKPQYDVDENTEKKHSHIKTDNLEVPFKAIEGASVSTGGSLKSGEVPAEILALLEKEMQNRLRDDALNEACESDGATNKEYIPVFSQTELLDEHDDHDDSCSHDERDDHDDSCSHDVVQHAYNHRLNESTAKLFREDGATTASQTNIDAVINNANSETYIIPDLSLVCLHDNSDDNDDDDNDDDEYKHVNNNDDDDDDDKMTEAISGRTSLSSSSPVLNQGSTDWQRRMFITEDNDIDDVEQRSFSTRYLESTHTMTDDDFNVSGCKTVPPSSMKARLLEEKLWQRQGLSPSPPPAHMPIGLFMRARLGRSVGKLVTTVPSPPTLKKSYVLTSSASEVDRSALVEKKSGHIKSSSSSKLRHKSMKCRPELRKVKSTMNFREYRQYCLELEHHARKLNSPRNFLHRVNQLRGGGGGAASSLKSLEIKAICGADSDNLPGALTVSRLVGDPAHRPHTTAIIEGIAKAQTLEGTSLELWDRRCSSRNSCMISWRPASTSGMDLGLMTDRTQIGRPIPTYEKIDDPEYAALTVTKLKEAKAAVDIQRIYRGFLARNYCKLLLREEREKRENERMAAIAIQRNYRSHLRRKQLVGQRTRPQKWEREYKMTRRVLEEDRTAKQHARQKELSRKNHCHTSKLAIIGPHVDIYQHFHPPKTGISMAAVDRAATKIQKHIRGWMVRGQMEALRRKASVMGITWIQMVQEYKKLLIRVQDRHGIIRPMAPFSFADINEFLAIRKRYECVFEKNAFVGELEHSDLQQFFKECDLHPAPFEIQEAFDGVFRGRELKKGRGLYKQEVMEMLFHIYPPRAAGLSGIRQSTWMNPIIDGEEARKLMDSEHVEQTDFKTCADLVCRSVRERKLQALEERNQSNDCQSEKSSSTKTATTTTTTNT